MAILSTDYSKGSKYGIETLPGKNLRCFTCAFNHRASAPFKKPPFDRFKDYEQNRGPSSWETQETNLTYCFPEGTGQDALRSQSQQTLHGQANVTDLPYVDMTVLSSAKSLYFPGASNLSSCTLETLHQGRWPDTTCQDDTLHFSMGKSSLLYYDLPGMDETIFCPFNIINHFVDYSVNPVHVSQSVNISGKRLFFFHQLCPTKSVQGYYPAFRDPVPSFPDNTSTEFMHSEWIKVALAAGVNGSIPAWRTAS